MTAGPTGLARPVIEVRDVGRTYAAPAGAVHALRSINFTVMPGEMVALRGRSGSGKTTLLNIIGALDHPTSGTATVLGQPLGDLSADAAIRWRAEQIGFVFQQHGLLSTMTALENVELALRLAGAPASGRSKAASSQLARVGLAEWAQHLPEQLSGGQQQRVAIARATAWSPRLLIADEPTGELDTATGLDILTLLRDHARHAGAAVLIATHDPAADHIVDRVVVLTDGVLEDDET